MNKTFSEIWREMSAAQREKFAITLAKKCDISIYTVRSYAAGARRPRVSSQKVMARILKVADYTTLFPQAEA